ncbi:MAG: hypothetical protein Q9190_001656 [Brigantiaea leucoxantha]
MSAPMGTLPGPQVFLVFALFVVLILGLQQPHEYLPIVPEKSGTESVDGLADGSPMRVAVPFGNDQPLQLPAWYVDNHLEPEVLISYHKSNHSIVRKRALTLQAAICKGENFLRIIERASENPTDPKHTSRNLRMNGWDIDKTPLFLVGGVKEAMTAIGFDTTDESNKGKTLSCADHFRTSRIKTR